MSHLNLIDRSLKLSTPSWLLRLKSSVRFKLTLPFLVLAVVFVIAGAFVASRVVYDSIQDRYINQLLEVSTLAADRIVVAERDYLETLRLIANTPEIIDAVAIRDTEALRQLILPIAVNSQQNTIVVLDTSGVSIVELHHHEGTEVENYEYSHGDSRYARWSFVERVRAQEIENGRDKFAGIGEDEKGFGLYVAGPIRDTNDGLIGIILVGNQLSQLVSEIRSDTFGQIGIYNFDGVAMASTLLLPDAQSVNLTPAEVEIALRIESTNTTSIRRLSSTSVNYREVVSSMQVRSGQNIAIIGTALPETFLTKTSMSTQIQFILIVMASLAAVIAAGIYLSKIVTNPIIQLVGATKEVEKGNFKVYVRSNGKDEVSQLANSFNKMVKGLRRVTTLRLREAKLRTQIEQERELRDLKSRFISMVSHEFRTPLTTILSSNEYLRLYGDSIPAHKKNKHVERIGTAVQTMTMLLEDVLVIGKSEAGKLDFNPKSINLSQFCEDIVDEIQASASEQYDIELRVINCGNKVLIDPKLMRLALSNLLTNAVKYSPQGGRVYMLIHCKNDRIAFQIRDHGIGIPEEDQKRLFEAFHRANNVDNIQGTGLGLYITKMIAEIHDGAIKCTSRQGFGTKFTIVIPKREER